MIGRVYSAHPGEGERLLNHVIGCTSYEISVHSLTVLSVIPIRKLPSNVVC